MTDKPLDCVELLKQARDILIDDDVYARCLPGDIRLKWHKLATAIDQFLGETK